MCIRDRNKAIEFDNKLFLVSDPGYKHNVGNLLVYDLIKKKLIAYKLGVNAILFFSPSKDQLWISSFTNFYIFNGFEGNNILLKPFPYSDHHLPEGAILHSICKDRQNNIWFTNEYTGLCKLSNQQLVYYPEYKPGLTVNDISVTPFTDSVWLYDGDHGQAWLALPHHTPKKFLFEKPLGSGRFLFAKKGFVTIANNIYSFEIKSADQFISLKPYYTDSDTAGGIIDALLDNNENLVTASTRITAFADDQALKASFDYMTDQFTIDKKNRIWVAPRSNKLFCFEIPGHSSDAKLILLKKFETITTNSPRSI